MDPQDVGTPIDGLSEVPARSIGIKSTGYLPRQSSGRCKRLKAPRRATYHQHPHHQRDAHHRHPNQRERNTIIYNTIMRYDFSLIALPISITIVVMILMNCNCSYLEWWIQSSCEFHLCSQINTERALWTEQLPVPPYHPHAKVTLA